MSKVSIVIPCYNSAAFIDRCLESVWAQDHPDMEVVCVNDGSLDHTMDKLKAQQEKRPGLHIIDQQNQGATAARNAGTAKATGDYIQYLDSDDYILPQKISSQIELAERHSFPDLIIGSYTSVAEYQGEKRKVDRIQDKNGNVWIKLMRTDLGITSANLFKRQAVLDVGGWDESLRSSQEYDLMFRILQGKESYVYDPVLSTRIYIQAQGSITSGDQRANWKRYIDLRLRIKSYLKKSGKEVPQDEVHQCLFDAIRQLYPHDKREAKRLYKEHLPSAFLPRISGVTSGGYVKLFRVLGFGKAERVRSMMGR